MADALSRMASSTATVSPSSDNSLRMLVPPDIRSTIGMSVSGGMQARSTPRVSISELAYGNRSLTVSYGSSRPDVGPRK